LIAKVWSTVVAAGLVLLPAFQPFPPP
jgi:hypothetical protein